MFKEWKKTISKELKESVRTVSHQIENINMATGLIKKDQIEILDLKSVIIEMKNSLGQSSRFE